ncbi:MAG: hypothetical protein MUF35_00215 [Candidatus Nanopelagicales bacterium]|jgi:hypothetical protein|nr:hypothetical protein [Candidatus Nanopelagicales bacterium]
MADAVRPLVLIAAVEALLGIGALAAEVVAVVRGTEGLAGAGAGRAAVEVLLWVLAIAALVLIWLGLYRRRALALTPFLLVQLFVLVAAVPLLFPSDLVVFRGLAIALGLLAVAGLVLGLRPRARSLLH